MKRKGDVFVSCFPAAAFFRPDIGEPGIHISIRKFMIKLFLLLFLLTIPSLSRGQQNGILQGKSITLTDVFVFHPQSYYFRFKVSYTAPMAVLPLYQERKTLEIRDVQGALLENVSPHVQECAYELHTGNGTFTMRLGLQDISLSQDSRLHIKGNVPLTCARLSSLPVLEASLQERAAYSIPLCIPPFIKEGNDAADLTVLPCLTINIFKHEKKNTWGIGLSHPMDFRYAGMEFFDAQNRSIPAIIAPSGFRSGPPTYHPYTCVFPKAYDRVQIKIQYERERAAKIMPVNLTVGLDGILHSETPPPAN